MRLRPIYVGFAMLLGGCSSHVTSAVMPGVNVAALKTAYVTCQPKEDANICAMLAENLQVHGFKAAIGAGPAPGGEQVAVSYEDRWAWDMAPYLLALRVEMRDPQTNVLLATSQVFATSLARRSPERMARECIEAILTGKQES